MFVEVEDDQDDGAMNMSGRIIPFEVGCVPAPEQLELSYHTL